MVTAVNGTPIYDPDGLVLEVGKLPVEAVARLSLLREERSLNLDVKLSKFPVSGKKIVTAPPPSWRGLRVDYTDGLAGDGPAWPAALRRRSTKRWW